MKLLKEKVIKIGDKEYPSKMSIKAMIEFEELSGHSISDYKATIQETTFLFYATIKAGGLDVTYAQFLDLIDDKPESIKSFSDQWIEKVEKKQTAR